MASVADDEARVRLARGARARARLLRVVLARARRRRPALLRRALDRRAGRARASAAARSARTRCRRAHPYVLLNWTARRRDVLTLAHELGHGVHAALARARRASSTRRTPLTLAETASVFGETVMFGRLLDEADRRPPSRLALLAENLEGTIATVFRQIAMNRFEDLVHTARRERGRAVGRALRRAVGRDARTRCSATRSRSPTATARGGRTSRTSSARPGYVYAYAYGQLLALSVYAPLRGARATTFVPRYLELLAAGGSRRPEELGSDRRRRPRRPRASGTAGLDIVERQLGRPRRPPSSPDGCRPTASPARCRRRCTRSNRGWGTMPKNSVAAPARTATRTASGWGRIAVAAGACSSSSGEPPASVGNAPSGAGVGRGIVASLGLGAGASRIHIAAITRR